MSNDAIKVIIDKLNKEGDMFFVEGATAEQITDFEKKYHITLPEQFKEWLKFSDGGEFFLPAGVQLYGVAHKPCIDVDDSDRPDERYIVIGSLASGDPVLCDITSEKISIYNHEAGRIEDDEIYLSFFDFLNDLYIILGMGG